MQSPQGICYERLTSATTRLEKSLLRLHHSLEEVQRYENRSDRLFERWQEKSPARSEGIFERLELIEAQLDNLIADDDIPLRLGIVGDADEAHSVDELSVC